MLSLMLSADVGLGGNNAAVAKGGSCARTAPAQKIVNSATANIFIDFFMTVSSTA